MIVVLIMTNNTNSIHTSSTDNITMKSHLVCPRNTRRVHAPVSIKVLHPKLDLRCVEAVPDVAFFPCLVYTLSTQITSRLGLQHLGSEGAAKTLVPFGGAFLHRSGTGVRERGS